MTRHYRLLLLGFPLVIGLGSMAMPGRAQQAPGGRFAFADTTLLRDTLGLSFEGLFPLADSLSLSPDTLRALSIRYRYTLPRLLKLADSLGVVVDSVGPILRRERFNPLATGVRKVSNFGYNSSYGIGQNYSTWINLADYQMGAGPAVLTHETNIQIDRRLTGGRTGFDQTRTLSTRADWRFSRDLSVGGKGDLSRTGHRTRGASLNHSVP